MNKLIYFLRLIETVRYLKLIQIFYQLKKRLKKVKLKGCSKTENKYIRNVGLDFMQPSLIKKTSYQSGYFNFLNIPQIFENNNIDWNSLHNGKLWTYNLNYFDYLSQSRIDTKEAIYLIKNFIENVSYRDIGFDPYPISLRGINWIKFLNKNSINKESINKHLFNQYKYLEKNLEYHLMGNHLIENAFSLLFGAYFFKNKRWYLKSKKIISNQLSEQVCYDGAHFERSPMYHSIILERLLDCINLLQNNQIFENQNILLKLIAEKGSCMLGWLESISCAPDEIPHFKDSVEDIGPKKTELIAYSKSLGLKIQRKPLSDSGYRRFDNSCWSLIADVGNIGPDYIPGHAHADCLNFVYYHKKKPIIVDTGTSTYENNELRQLQRSTISHNTVEIDRQNSSDVWSSFRVGRRAKTAILKDQRNMLIASHDGYKNLGIIHKRSWIISKEKIKICDELIGKPKLGRAYIHFDHRIKPRQSKCFIIVDEIKIRISGAQKIVFLNYDQALGFNKTLPAVKVMIEFYSNLQVEILHEAVHENPLCL